VKVGIIVHSHTGNTLSVAQKLQEALTAAGHFVQLERVTAVNEDPQVRKVELKSAPDPSPYDTVIFAAPVRAFSLSPVMRQYLAQVPSLKDKAVGCFVTQGFPYPWLGGNRTIRQMVSACEALGGKVLNTCVINWTHKGRETGLAGALETMGKCVL